MSQAIMSIDEVKGLIEKGRILLLSGDEAVLGQLPQGKWIGGTIPYFMSKKHGGISTKEMVFCTDLSDAVESANIIEYNENSLAKVYSEAPEDGFCFVLIPALSQTHLTFALNAPNYKDFGVRPLIGWITGVHLDDLGKVAPKVINGETGKFLEDAALVMQAKLPQGKAADIGIINLFEQGDGDILTFPQDGFSATDVFVNGEKQNFAEYLTKNNFDTKLPLVADYYGASVNISFQAVDTDAGEVKFYAPVFSSIRYKHAKPVGDYVNEFTEKLKSECGLDENRLLFSCNCILNYLYSELEGKKTDPMVGPITFGEIAYQLLNQTLVYLEIHDV
ncbi:DUF6976 family protein [Desulfovibrio inopinatus]|uniref:DUF6976 family protein n=1 Tax=Desulfovibrio inopinatus TaxID=102109 RepID=UPI000414F22B|nr:hypothetical protein [Desulfovibrio inopinatus]